VEDKMENKNQGEYSPAKFGRIYPVLAVNWGTIKERGRLINSQNNWLSNFF